MMPSISQKRLQQLQSAYISASLGRNCDVLLTCPYATSGSVQDGVILTTKAEQRRVSRSAYANAEENALQT